MLTADKEREKGDFEFKRTEYSNIYIYIKLIKL